MKRLKLSDYLSMLKKPHWALNYLFIFKLNLRTRGQITVNGNKFIFNNSSKGAFLKLITKRFVINDTIENIIDIGATIGEDAFRYIKYYSPKKVLMVEASQKNYGMLKENIKNLPNVAAMRGYVCANDDKDILILDNGQAAGWRKTENIQSVRAQNTELVRPVRLSDLFEEFGDDPICLLKISINGAENELIELNGNIIFERSKYIAISLFEKINPGVAEKFYKSARITHNRIMINEGFELWCRHDINPDVITRRCL